MLGPISCFSSFCFLPFLSNLHHSGCFTSYRPTSAQGFYLISSVCICSTVYEKMAKQNPLANYYKCVCVSYFLKIFIYVSRCCFVIVIIVIIIIFVHPASESTQYAKARIQLTLCCRSVHHDVYCSDKVNVFADLCLLKQMAKHWLLLLWCFCWGSGHHHVLVCRRRCCRHRSSPLQHIREICTINGKVLNLFRTPFTSTFFCVCALILDRCVCTGHVTQA